VLVGFVALGAFFTAVWLVLLLVVAMCSAGKRGAGFVAQQMVFHLFQEWEQSGHALLGDGRMLSIVGG
jgi:hypothetical protein